jgi:hypothetical protein
VLIAPDLARPGVVELVVVEALAIDVLIIEVVARFDSAAVEPLHVRAFRCDDV